MIEFATRNGHVAPDIRGRHFQSSCQSAAILHEQESLGHTLSAARPCAMGRATGSPTFAHFAFERPIGTRANLGQMAAFICDFGES
jgi:hypothetical protein